MGLDMYAFAVAKQDAIGEFEMARDCEREELHYWRKHHDLHGWMEKLWLRKNGYPSNTDDQFIEGKEPPSFNGIELELTWDDLDNLERAIRHGQLPETEGFFFGNPADGHYYKQDLEFVNNAKAEVFLGLKVFYNSSW